MQAASVTHPENLNNLINFAKRLIDGENGRELILMYKHSLESVTAEETMKVLDHLLTCGYSFSTVKNNVGRILNAFFRSLNDHKWKRPAEPHFLYYLMLENRAVEKLIAGIRPSLRLILGRDGTGSSDSLVKVRNFIMSLKEYELHYIKKENILFPYLEKTFTQYRCLQLMWSFHDDFRQGLKTLEEILSEEAVDRERFNREIGKLFFVIFPIIFREEQIVFPVAMDSLPTGAWNEMLAQSFETGWCYGISPAAKDQTAVMSRNVDRVDLGTGLLKPGQIILMLENLPVDITFVDENDEVCYFSGSKHRIFPRSKAIIGRKVQNCHPHESVHVVNEILEAFRNGSRDQADFWIQSKGRFIHIRYFAMRDAGGSYKGTIEVSQDVTGIRSLQGEKRLLDWGCLTKDK
ncbi:MAG TPA: PAS domain-containing protein [Bacteroidales bacterium]|nr:DUF438 domain-containing protein [Bacteroidales bacterium]HNR42465.1 PAS domain-containing protein [Bacteroidales bacterium]HPM17399.1 PAS domain-containing protein [Bacteroidales bacterium]